MDYPPKQIHPDEFDAYLNDGWMFGKVLAYGDKKYKWSKGNSTWEIMK